MTPGLALLLAFTSGIHDAPNAIAPLVATRGAPSSDAPRITPADADWLAMPSIGWIR